MEGIYYGLLGKLRRVWAGTGCRRVLWPGLRTGLVVWGAASPVQALGAHLLGLPFVYFVYFVYFVFFVFFVGGFVFFVFLVFFVFFVFFVCPEIPS